MRGVVLLLIALFIIQTTEGETRSRGFNYKDRMQRSSYNDISGGKEKNLQTSSSNARKGSPLSAWGIIGIILAAIIITTTGYYAFVFYPYICKKQHPYGMIELANVV